MKTKTLLFALLIIVVGLLTAFFACGGGDDDDDDSSGDDDVGEGEPGQLQGYVHDFQTKTAVAGAFVEALNDETGEPFDPAITATSPADGSVTLEFPDGITKVGIKVTKEGATDTIQYHFEVGVKGEEFLLVSDDTKTLVSLSLGEDIDPAKAVTAGGVYWGDPSSEDSVGCSVVSFDPTPTTTTHYFGPDALPNLARDVSGDTPANGQGTNPGYDAKGHAISYYVNLNMDVADNVTLTGTIYETQSTGLSGTSYTETNTIPKLYADTATITNVYFYNTDYAANPTPSWCTQ